jgi:surface antigen
MLAIPAAQAASFGSNCVYYARHVSGISLDGNAGAWWSHAEGRYERGRLPSVGAVLVFRPSGHMRVGHVAVVSRVVNRREILVDQANWVRGRVVKNMSVIDASPQNDWTMVKVVELHSRVHGRANPTYGFIYPRAPSPPDGDSLVAAESDTSRRKLSVRLAIASGHSGPTEAIKAAPHHPKRHRTQPAGERRDKGGDKAAPARRDRAAHAAPAERDSHPKRTTPRIESAAPRG